MEGYILLGISIFIEFAQAVKNSIRIKYAYVSIFANMP